MSSPESLVRQAEKLTNHKPSFFGSVFGSSTQQNCEEAGDLYVQAANQYKINKQLTKAGECFDKAAQALIKADNKDEAANVLVDAYKAYKNEDPARAAASLEQAIDFFTARGQFRRGANFKMDLAQLYEEQVADFGKALKAYEDAGDWFESDSAQALSNKAFLKAADLNALQENYLPATEIYKKIVKSSLNNNLSRWSLKDYFVKIVFCYLAADDRVAADKYLNESLTLDSTFQSTREYKLLQNIIEAVNDGDAETLSQVLFDYDQFSKLDSWKTSILLKIKSNVTDAEDDLL